MKIVPRNIDVYTDWKNFPEPEPTEVVEVVVILSNGKKYTIAERMNKPGMLDISAGGALHIHPAATNSILITEG